MRTANIFAKYSSKRGEKDGFATGVIKIIARLRANLARSFLFFPPPFARKEESIVYYLPADAQITRLTSDSFLVVRISRSRGISPVAARKITYKAGRNSCAVSAARLR